MSKVAAGAAARSKVGDDDHTARDNFINDYKFSGNALDLSRFQGFIEKEKMGENLMTISYLENEGGAYTIPTPPTSTSLVKPSYPPLREGADANETNIHERESAKLELDFTRLVMDSQKHEQILNAHYQTSLLRHVSYKEKGWAWLNKHVVKSVLNNHATSLKTNDPQAIFQKLVECSAKDKELSDHLLRTQKRDKFRAFYLNLKTQQTNYVRQFSSRYLELGDDAEMPEAIMSEILRRLLRGHTYKGANGITAKLLDMSKVDDLAETTSLTDLLANAETEYDKYVTDVSVQGGSVAVMLDPARQLVEREYALRLAEYQQKYRDSSLAEEMASMICGTCNVITTPQGKGGSTDSSVSASSGKFPRMCLNCEGTCSNLAACPQKHCGICQKLHANSKLVHNDPKKPRQCPLFPYALKHYRDTGSLPTKRSFFAAYKVPDELSQRAFPDSKGAANSKGDKFKGDS